MNAVISNGSKCLEDVKKEHSPRELSASLDTRNFRFE